MSENETAFSLERLELLRFFIPALGLWMNAGIFLLVFAIPLLEIAEFDLKTPILGSGNQVLFVAQLLSWLSLCLFGHYMDKERFNLDPWIIISLFGVSIGMFMLFLIPNFVVGVMAYFILGISMGPLAIGLVEIYDELVDWRRRSRTFSIVIIVFSLITVGELLIIRFVVPLLHVLPLLGFLNFFLGFCYLYVSFRLPKTYHDRVLPSVRLSGYKEFPVDLFTWKSILSRPSVRNYAISHSLIYFVIGVTTTSVIAAGVNTLGVTSARIEFWMVALLFDGLFVLLSGILSDKIGRKSMIILGTYVIGVSGFIQGYLSEIGVLAFYLSAMGFGIGFSFIHVTLDSSVWADLAPRSATGKYYAIAYVSLIFGLGWGIFVGLYYLPTNLLITGIFILLASFMATFPLFWAEDSYPPLDPMLLMVMLESGVLLLYHTFHPDLLVRETVSSEEEEENESYLSLPLVASAFSAIISFMKTVTRSRSNTTVIHQVDQEILVQRHRSVLGVVFVNRTTKELQSLLFKYLNRFVSEYQILIENWTGDILPFRWENDIIDRFFAPIIPYKFSVSKESDNSES